MEKHTDDFYLSRQEPNKSCLLALRKIILDMDAEVGETVKYGMPCFTYQNKMFAYLWEDKKTVSLTSCSWRANTSTTPVW